MLARLSAVLFLAVLVVPPLQGQVAGSGAYWLYVASESEDEVALLRFEPGPNRIEVEKTIAVGVRPTEIEGPHGLRVSPDGEFWYVSLAHGNPYGAVYKYTTGDDQLVASAEAGLFPATLDVASSTGLLYVVNFDLHGDMAPSTVSVIDTGTMTEVAQIEVGVMPHSSRLNAAGNRQYSVMMMSDELVEVDAFRFETLRRLRLSDSVGMATAKPTWVHPSPDGRYVYVASNGVDQVVEVDLESWKVVRTFKTGAGPYNLEVTPDGSSLVVTHKSEGTTGVVDLATGEELARIENSRSVTHGVAVSPDSRYAFVSVEGVAGEPGAVDVIDLEALMRVASADVGKQASGIAFWKVSAGP